MSAVASADRLESARAAAARVADPELPFLTIEDLGVLHAVEADERGQVTVTILPTYSGCPAMNVIALEIETELLKAGFPGAREALEQRNRAARREGGQAPPVCGGANCRLPALRRARSGAGVGIRTDRLQGAVALPRLPGANAPEAALSRFHALEIVDKRGETFDSVSIAFALPEALRKTFAFKPGQYLSLRARIAGEEITRSYSICSALGDKELRIAVRRAEHGRFSRFLNDELRQGDRIDVAPPDGRFTAKIGAAAHSVFFAAGSGITPVISIIRSALAASEGARATLVYGNRTTESIMFRAALDEMKDRWLGRLAVFHVLSRESQEIAVLDGRIDADKVALFASTIAKPEEVDAYFLCGPFGMIETARSALIAAGADPKRIKAELFATDGAGARPSARAGRECGGSSGRLRAGRPDALN